jgi:hypothetical protein
VHRYASRRLQIAQAVRTGAEVVTEQPRELLSREELEFLSRWRQQIDRLGGSGGQKRVAEVMDWKTSTVSRDYQSKTLPSDQRLRELSNYLKLAGPQRHELEILLKLARDARHARRKADSPGPFAQTSALVPAREEPDAGAPAIGSVRSARRWLSRRPRIAVAVVVVAVAAGVLGWSSQGGAQAELSVRGSYPGEGLKTVPVPVKSLPPKLAAVFRQGRTAGAATVTGYEFRSAQGKSLCLTAASTGSTAGQDRDPVEVATCGFTANQIWIPEQWEVNGSTFTHLVSVRYPSKCLNAKKINGGLSSGQPVMLWDCYRANNESWDFGDWYRNVKPGHHSYPVLLHTDRLCLDVDDAYGESGAVDIQIQQTAPGQFWS